MATSRDTPNPLRPYYVPPSIGIQPEKATSSTAPGASSSRVGIGKSARDLLSDLDYGGPLLDRDGPTVGEMGKKIVDQAIWKYTSVLLAQPFDVAKTILQVRLAEEEEFLQDTPARDRQSLRIDEVSQVIRMHLTMYAEQRSSILNPRKNQIPTRPPTSHQPSPLSPDMMKGHRTGNAHEADDHLLLAQNQPHRYPPHMHRMLTSSAFGKQTPYSRLSGRYGTAQALPASGKLRMPLSSTMCSSRLSNPGLGACYPH